MVLLEEVVGIAIYSVNVWCARFVRLADA